MFLSLSDPDWLILSIKLVDPLQMKSTQPIQFDILLIIPDNTHEKSIAIILKVPVKRTSNIHDDQQAYCKIIYRVFKGLGIIYFVTHWVIYSSVSIGNIFTSRSKNLSSEVISSAENLNIQNCCVSQVGSYIASQLHIFIFDQFLCTLLINKSLSYANLSLEWLLVSTF